MNNTARTIQTIARDKLFRSKSEDCIGITKMEDANTIFLQTWLESFHPTRQYLGSSDKS